MEQLKATLKEEKRVRADSEKPVEPTTTSADADTPDVSAADSERRKRRKVDAEESEGEILDGPLPVSDSIEAKPQEKVDIDSAKLEQVSADNQPTKSPSKPAAAVSSQDAAPNVIDDAVKPNAVESACPDVIIMDLRSLMPTSIFIGTETTNKSEPEPTLDAPAALKVSQFKDS